MKYDPAGYWEFRYKGQFYYGGTLHCVLVHGFAEVFPTATSDLLMMALELMSWGRMEEGKDGEHWSILHSGNN
jgi:hypothetical protein